MSVGPAWKPLRLLQAVATPTGIEDVGATTSNDSESREKAENDAPRVSETSEPPSALVGVGANAAAQPTEPSDADLESALVRAMLEGRGAVAEHITTMLRARQLARAGNVVPLATRRGRS